MTDISQLINQCISDYNRHTNLNIHIETYIASLVPETKYVIELETNDGSIVKYEFNDLSSANRRLLLLPNVGEKFRDKNVIRKELKTVPKELHVFENNSDTIYYSSQLNMSLVDFRLKDITWMSSQLDQSLLHVFHINLNKLQKIIGDIQPVIFRFKLRNIKFLKSFFLDNSNIFKNVLPDELITLLDLILKSHGISDGMSKFIETQNVYILLILKELNKFLSDSNKIYGYANYFDQNEIGVTNFSEIVITDSVQESKYKKLNLDGSEIIFPSSKLLFGNYGVTRYEPNIIKDKKRMIIENHNITITYSDFDTGVDIFWNNPADKSEYYKFKYLKYKQKYLQLKNKIQI